MSEPWAGLWNPVGILTTSAGISLLDYQPLKDVGNDKNCIS